MFSTYRSYHSGLKLRYAYGILQSDITNSIPISTKQGWKGKNIQSFWTPYLLREGRSDDAKLVRLERENAKLKVQAKSLFNLVSIYKDLTALSPFKSNQVLKVRRGVEHLMRSCNGSGFEKLIWRYLPFSFKQWKAWSGQKHCLNSLQGYCRKQNPQQLSILEQGIIKTGCSNKEYEHWPLSGIYYQLLRDQKVHCSLSTFYKYCKLLNITGRVLRILENTFLLGVYFSYFLTNRDDQTCRQKLEEVWAYLDYDLSTKNKISVIVALDKNQASSCITGSALRLKFNPAYRRFDLESVAWDDANDNLSTDSVAHK